MAKKKDVDLRALREIFEENDTAKSKLALSLLDKAEFMEETLKILQEKVKKDPSSFAKIAKDRENPALRSYNTTIKNYTSVIKQLNDMLPAQETPKDDGFESFGDDE